MRVLGIILIVAGALALAYQGITFSKREKVLDLGPFQATAEKKETIPIPPWVGGGALAAGVLLVFVGGSRRR
jgi:hypothetical protein